MTAEMREQATALHVQAQPGDASRPILEMRGIVKRFPGVVALDDVSFDCLPGEVHALVGENGAGKSTLIKILAGAYIQDEGSVLVDGRQVSFRHPQEAQLYGVSVIYQEFNLLPHRTVAQNIFLGREPTRYGLIDYGELEAKTHELLSQLDVHHTISPRALVGSLPVAQQQIVEIAKALSFESRVLVMDEPTAALATSEVEGLFDLVRLLQTKGMAVVYISHRLKEVFELGNRITVLRDGKRVGTVAARDVTAGDVIKMMVGRELSEYFPPRAEEGEIGDFVLRVKNGSNASLHGIDIELRSGEIVGLAGLQGSGRTELAKALFGINPLEAGDIELRGRPVHIRSPRQAITGRMGFVTDDRKQEGIVPNQSVRNNILLAFRSMQRFLGSATTNGFAGYASVSELAKKVDLRTSNYDQEVARLSGGNQQKTVLAKWLAVSADILIFAEPTRGIDVNAKAGIYDLIREFARAGGAVLMISSELPEIIGMSDRILVMRDGTIAGECPAGSSETEIMVLATHGSKSDQS